MPPERAAFLFVGDYIFIDGNCRLVCRSPSEIKAFIHLPAFVIPKRAAISGNPNHG
jgi:hypothetical protein